MSAPARSPVVPEAPVLAAGFAAAAWLDTSGEVTLIAPQDAASRVASARPIVCHGPATARRLGIERFVCFDLLELFAFVRPARFCLPTPRGLAEALGLAQPRGLEDEAVALHNVTRALMAELGATTPDPRLSRLAWTMAKAGWSWGPAVLGTLGLAAEAGDKGSGLDVWSKLPEWQDYAPPPPPGSEPVEPAEARKRLAAAAGRGSRSTAAAGRLRLGRCRRLRPAPGGGRAAIRAGRSRHGRGQDAGLYRARQPLGRAQ